MVEIEILGNLESEEGRAGLKLKSILENGLPSKIEGKGIIEVNKRVYGKSNQDIDLILALFLNEAADFEFNNTSIKVKSFITIIEVKNVQNLDITGSQAKIFHKGNPKPTFPELQAHGEKDALVSFFKVNLKEYIHVNCLLWFLKQDSSYFSHDLDRIYLGENFTIEELMLRLYNTGVRFDKKNNEKNILNNIPSLNTYLKIAKILSHQVQCSELDLKRINEISQKRFDEKANYINNNINVSLNGNAGTGKTIYALSIANYLRVNLRKRVLVLTYNKLLVMDIIRILYYYGVGNPYSEDAMHIQTVHSFLRSILIELEILSIESKQENFFRKYNSALKILHEKVMSKEININNIPSHYCWDRFIIDEGQDWPDIERDILYGLFGSDKFIIVESGHQLIRTSKPCDWSVPNTQPVNLRKVVRSKSNILKFLDSYSSKYDLDFKSEGQFSGGRVIILEGKYTKEFHDKLNQLNDKNKNFDMLYLVPPSLKNGDESLFAQFFRKHNLEYWDTTVDEHRSAWPTSMETFRIVPYESSRGLEGYITVCIDYTSFFEYKRKDAEAFEKDYSSDSERNPISAFLNHSRSPDFNAAKWSLIPFTRAVDTLVIQLFKPSEDIKKIFLDIYEENKEIIEWYKPGQDEI